ncbi:hypothetical protein PR202_ga21411 [Eleusine coracana subsp. coracana]|uniref:HECT-type E3 ubiquitin transferase n=1 Tax=Eleusine coracana subsp. coracana TaxID=191504 RepID=A0AAV5D0Y7_ELECO|nr:hypothetical protein PR202_ga21411 [Eleusine coracana subsp. coracana]
MASPTAAASESGAVVQLLLRNIDSRTTVVRAQLDETLDSVLQRLGHAVDLRVVHAGRCLPRGATIDELGLQRDATLHVTSRLLSTPHPDAFNLASELAAAARLAHAQPDYAASLDRLVWGFLNAARARKKRSSSGPLGRVAAHMTILLRSGAPAALGQLYLSEREPCRVGAERAIRRLLTPDLSVMVWITPALLELCSSVAAGGSARRCHADDPLYADLRRALASLLGSLLNHPVCWLDVSPEWAAEHLTRLVVDKASAVVEQIARAHVGLMRTTTTQMAVTNKDKDLVLEFKKFLSALRQHVTWLVGADDAPRRRRPWWMALYEALASLLRGVDEYMATVETFLWRRAHEPASPSSSSAALEWIASSLPCVRAVLTELDAWSDVDAAWPEISAAHAGGTEMLVLTAEAESGAEWSQTMGWVAARHRDLLSFDTRRYLAMALLPRLAAAGSDDDARHEMLVDRSRLLADSFGSVANAAPEKLRAGLVVEFRDELATGPGVRREWFCLVFRALFSPSQVLFSACPSDRRKFFVNPGCKKILEMDSSLLDSNTLGLTFSSAVELLLRNFDSQTDILPAKLDDTLDSVLECLSNGKAVVAYRGTLRVEYVRRCLRGEVTIGELELLQDATLHVTIKIIYRDLNLIPGLELLLRTLIIDPRWSPASCWVDASPERVVEALTWFISEKADIVMGYIVRAYPMTRTAVKEELVELKVFLSVLRQQVLDADEAPSLRKWRAALYETLVSLPRSVNEYMATVEASPSLQQRMPMQHDNWPCVLLVLAELDEWADTDAWPEIRAALAAHEAATVMLVLCGGTEWYIEMGWITRHGDLFGFDTRRHLAMALLPKLATGGGGTGSRH